jgi:hypothetical protein
LLIRIRLHKIDVDSCRPGSTTLACDFDPPPPPPNMFCMQ